MLVFGKVMFPTVFSTSKFTLSSFGLFLILGLILMTFAIWKISRAYEVDEEKSLDLLLLSLVGAFLSARVLYILLNFQAFDSFFKWILINKYPGLSFWGAILGGFLIMRIFYRKFKLNFWQVADFFIVGLFVAATLGSIGCFLGACDSGVPSNLFLAVDQVGLLGRRFPIQIVEFFIFLFLFVSFYKQVLRFHFNGQILAKGLIALGITKFVLWTFISRDSASEIDQVFNLLTPLLCVILGTFIYYKKSKKSFKKDFIFLMTFLFNPTYRKVVVLHLQRSWYNLSIKVRLKFLGFKKNWQRKLNIKPNPTKF
jgi:phosphatidylglycerol---prolipoprotein diacylglyceryl transferase